MKYCAVALACAVVVALASDGLAHLDSFAQSAAIKKLAEFDFAGYAFGLVAVAVSFSSVYISVIPESCIGQLKGCAERHLFPVPFSDWRDIRDKCHPDKGIHRNGRIKTLYVLAIWGTIGKAQREHELGPDGLDESESWLNRPFHFFEAQSDRLVAAALGVLISIIYLAVPLVYPFVPVHMGFAMLATIYVLCIVDVFACALMYWQRSVYVQAFDGQARNMVETCQQYLTTLLTAASVNTPPEA